MIRSRKRTRARWVLLLALVVALLLAACGDDDDGDGGDAVNGAATSMGSVVDISDEAPTLVVHNPWVRATAGDDTTMTGAFLDIYNVTGQDERLIAVRSDLTETVEIHETTMENDVMQMRPVEGGIEIPVGSSVSLQPGGLHIMLLDLPGPLVEGDTVNLTLVFESGKEVVLDAPVRPLVPVDEE